MLKQVEYHPEAKREIEESAIWYDEQSYGLGLEFLCEIKNTESHIVKNSELYPVYEAGTRRCIMHRFPFSVVYLILKEKIQIVAVSHCKRKPWYWGNRL